ncbi:uncharacterized protein PGTG_19464 [Puccinia graminis f. sp. tritici CRL 75-36-700-3]|uniref:Uncharacterized protein n=1 Tax=Puccinia graminis f. sp. tritici (strain CRL 75-36-700-3 / race SCCL) TaxID=418459 RepID=E3LAB3_PUCGT|nr:uncharacterized protein PGTG_19464 [Puccinia graminis f. sp. tritici CRL 75-36-700-3]EFP93488.2 hypothetical protein PGTG_19464 [Puccinia graminis f. sp. tritici CRL 75-36-700-3]
MFSPIFDSSFSMDSSTTNNNNETESGFLSAKLTLDMSFNRNPEGRFACDDVDPLEQQGPDFVQPTPSFGSIAEEYSGLEGLLEAWKFPLRTDFARGIIWGPFRHYRGNSYAELASPETAIENLRSYAEHAMFPARIPQAPVRRQRIFPILRAPQPQQQQPQSTPSSIPTTSASTTTKSSSKRRRRPSTTSFIIPREPRPSRAAAIKSAQLQLAARTAAQKPLSSSSRRPRRPSPPQPTSANKKPKFIHLEIAVQPSPKSDLPIRRIRLCATSLLKYGDLL